MRKELGLKRRERAVEGGNNKKKRESEHVVSTEYCVYCIVYCINFIRRFPLLHSFSKAGDSFVLAVEDVTKMNPYP